METTEAMTLPQGDVGLLKTEVARRLLSSRELGRLAYVAAAITIDAASTPPEVLLVRGRAEITDVAGASMADFERRGR